MENYWWKEAKFYEFYVDKFAGDFRSLTEHVDYFVALGINTLHILPHYPSPLVDQGYDISDYCSVRQKLGTLEDFRHFIETAHEKGVRVITDFVANHVSQEHPWFIEARSSRDNPHRDFFLWSERGEKFAEGINAFPGIKTSNWISNPATGDFYYATFYPEQPDLNWDNTEVRREMLDTMDFWVGLGVDGFRLDAAAHLVKREGTNCKGLPQTHTILKMIRAHLDLKYPRNIVLLAEAAQDVESTKAYFGEGDECHLIYHFPLMAQMWRSLAEDEAEYAKKMLEQSGGIPENCAWAVFLRNHDEIELSTLDEASRRKLVDFLDPQHVYLFNNGATTAVRIADVWNGDEQKIRKAFDLLYSMPGAPVMYYGDEIGMRNEPPRAGVVDSRIYVRGTFDWAEAKRQMTDPHSLFNYVAQLTHRTPVLTPVSSAPVYTDAVPDAAAETLSPQPQV